MAVTVSGEITRVLGALGQGVYDPGGLDLFGLAGATFEEERFPDQLYRVFPLAGLTVLYDTTGDDPIATSVFVHLTPEDGNRAYPTPDALIDGLPLTASGREDVRGHLGEPVHAGEQFDVFQVSMGYLHFEYDSDDNLTMVTAMLEVPGL